MESVQALMTGLIDYAGLFPPAELGMREAVENFAEYFKGPDSRWLGRFILPIERLDEFDAAAKSFLSGAKDEAPWQISALVKQDFSGAIETCREINARSTAGGFRVSAIEAPSAVFQDNASAPQDSIEVYVEVSPPENLEKVFSRLKNAGARAKLRTGGVTPAAFPTTGQVVRFLRACLDAGIAFKATAGLHHPIRAPYRLTYKPNADSATMFGFLNIFLGAAFMLNHADDVTVSRILEETDSSAFTFSESAITWRDRTLSTNRIASAREAFATSFGSCSFREPVEELKLLLSGAAV